MLTTVDKSEDTYGLSIGDSQIIQYNPFLDKLLLYDYKVANNLISASTANRNAALDEKFIRAHHSTYGNKGSE